MEGKFDVTLISRVKRENKNGTSNSSESKEIQAIMYYSNERRKDSAL